MNLSKQDAATLGGAAEGLGLDGVSAEDVIIAAAAGARLAFDVAVEFVHQLAGGARLKLEKAGDHRVFWCSVRMPRELSASEAFWNQSFWGLSTAMMPAVCFLLIT